MMNFNRDSSNGCPCRDCERRTDSCHGACHDYGGWKAEQDEKNRKLREQRGVNAMSDAKRKAIWRKTRYSRRVTYNRFTQE